MTLGEFFGSVFFGVTGGHEKLLDAEIESFHETPECLLDYVDYEVRIVRAYEGALWITIAEKE